MSELFSLNVNKSILDRTVRENVISMRVFWAIWARKKYRHPDNTNTY